MFNRRWILIWLPITAPLRSEQRKTAHSLQIGLEKDSFSPVADNFYTCRPLREHITINYSLLTIKFISWEYNNSESPNAVHVKEVMTYLYDAHHGSCIKHCIASSPCTMISPLPVLLLHGHVGFLGGRTTKQGIFIATNFLRRLLN